MHWHLYIIRLIDSHLCWGCGAGEETSAHVRVSVRFWLHSDIRIWVPFSYTQRMFDIYFWEQSVTYVKEQSSYDLDIRLWGAKGLHNRPKCIRTERARTHLLFCLTLR